MKKLLWVAVCSLAGVRGGWYCPKLELEYRHQQKRQQGQKQQRESRSDLSGYDGSDQASSIAAKAKSFYSGEPTGKLDDSTRAGLKQYQQAEGLKVTGTLNKVTLEKMGYYTNRQTEGDVRLRRESASDFGRAAKHLCSRPLLE
mgnify:CR=1 FL=1